jgi:hypothetical protein
LGLDLGFSEHALECPFDGTPVQNR